MNMMHGRNLAWLVSNLRDDDRDIADTGISMNVETLEADLKLMRTWTDERTKVLLHLCLS